VTGTLSPFRVTGDAQQRAWRQDLLPPVEEVRPGLWSIPVTWPGSPLRYTLSYVISYRDGVALVDTGWPTDAAWTALVDGVGQSGHGIQDVRMLLVTHAHADHLGMAAQLREASGAVVAMHPAEAATLGEPTRPSPQRAAWLRARGAPRAEVTELLEHMSESSRQGRSLALPDVVIEHESRPLGRHTDIRAVWTPGHTPGHLCFYDGRHDVMLTGDHLLPRISPHIGVPPGSQGDSLGQYLRSLRELARYEPAEVLPAHEYRFAGLGARVAALLRHHQIRLAEIEHAVACTPGMSTWAVAESLTWSRGWQQTRGMTRLSAVSETLAHLLHLEIRGRVLNPGAGTDAWTPGPRASAAD
jgi:glyoxylase-like metal-dependent hydrolase (beta-lactamase superfamily II)